MTFLQSLLLGTLQGLTEFLPVSSSGHLVLAEHFMGIHFPPATMMAFDVTLHAGTLFALFIYFWKTWWTLIQTFFAFLKIPVSKKPSKKDNTLLLILIVATLPVIITALLFKDTIDTVFRDPIFVLSFMGIIGIIMFLAEKFPKEKNTKEITFWHGLRIGLFEVFALLPGVSRSGTTISTAMFMGIPRAKAAEFSFLLGTPALLGATLYIGYEFISGSIQILPFSIMFTGFISSFIVSLICVHWLLQFLKKHSLRVFSYYLISISIIGLVFI